MRFPAPRLQVGESLSYYVDLTIRPNGVANDSDTFGAIDDAVYKWKGAFLQGGKLIEPSRILDKASAHIVFRWGVMPPDKIDAAAYTPPGGGQGPWNERSNIIMVVFNEKRS